MLALYYRYKKEFTGLIFEDIETAKKYIKTTIYKEEAYVIEPVAYYKANGEIE